MGGGEDRYVRVWDVLSGTCVRHFTGHKVSLAFLAALLTPPSLSGRSNGRQIFPRWPLHRLRRHRRSTLGVGYSVTEDGRAASDQRSAVPWNDLSGVQSRGQHSRCRFVVFSNENSPYYCRSLGGVDNCVRLFSMEIATTHTSSQEHLTPDPK